MFKLNFRYFFCALVLFITEVLIAVFVHDTFIRPTFGDVLVVMLMYCGIRTFVEASYRSVTLVTLLLAYIIEVTQYFNLIVYLGLEHSTLARCILGSSFSWGDMLAYTVGVAVIWVVERRRFA